MTRGSESLGKDDIRAAVGAGMISEAQAASVLALADSRRGVRETLVGQDEPFELFKGFNEIFIVIGLCILFAGWTGVTGLSSVLASSMSGAAMVYALIGMAVLAGLALYFTIRRRMIAPSIALTIMFGLSAAQAGLSFGWTLGLNYQERIALGCGVTTLSLTVWYLVFRIPFTVALVALGSFATIGAIFVLGGADLSNPRDLFLLSAEGPFAALTILLGVVGLAIALAFDLSDPHRVTRRSASGFWLHVIAAPAIVNTIALTLLEGGSVLAQALLLVFLAAMAVFAVVIDRRSFLVAGCGYVVALAVIVLEDGAMLAVLLLGLALVFLGAQWERLRGALLRALPQFPGKERLPPWGQAL